jgi:hypothetical protein
MGNRLIKENIILEEEDRILYLLQYITSVHTGTIGFVVDLNLKKKWDIFPYFTISFLFWENEVYSNGCFANQGQELIELWMFAEIIR